MNSDGTSKKFLLIRILICILLCIVTVLFVGQINALNILSQNYMLILIAAAAILCGLVSVLVLFAAKKTGTQIACSVLAVALAAGCGFGSFYVAKTGNMLGALTAAHSGKIANVVQVYALKDSAIKSDKDLEDKKIGVVKNVNAVGITHLLNDLKDKGITVKEEQYDNFGPLADALYDKEVSAIAINQVHESNITHLAKFTDFKDKAEVIYSFTYYTNATSAADAVTDITEEPFTVLINGSDSRGGLGDTDRSDVNMLAVVNPKTHVVLLVSIPRDAYVKTYCDPEYDCLEGQYDKLTHTGIHTYNTTAKTIEELMGIDINYVFRANFSAVVSIVDALGGIDVNVAPGYAVDYFYTNDMFGTEYGVEEGVNHLNGEAALCYARERYAYTEGDFQRIKNQQEVLTQIARKATSPEVIARYPALIDAIEGNFWTDVSQDEISELIQFQLDQMPQWTFISYSLSGTPDNRYCAEAYGNASVVILDQNTVKFADKLIKAVQSGDSGKEITDMIDTYEAPAPDYGEAETEGNNQVDPEYSAEYEYYEPVQEPVYNEPVYNAPVVEAPIYTPPVVVPETPAPEPDPVPEPTPEPEPAPVPVPEPTPEPEPVPEPAPEPSQEPAAVTQQPAA